MAFAGTSKIWNEIPKEIRMAQTLHSFKEHLKKHLAKQHYDSLVRSPCTGVVDLHRLGGSPQSRWMGMPGRWGFWISPDSLVIWVDAFLWGALACGWCLWSFLACTLVGMFGSLDVLLVGSLIVLKKIFFEGVHAFVRGVNDGFDCCAGILIFLLFSFFLSLLILEMVIL